MFNLFKTKNIKYDYENIKFIIKNLKPPEINWLYKNCMVVMFSMRIENTHKINDFFKKKNISKINKKVNPKENLNFVDEKWFIYEIFSEYMKRGNIISGKCFDSIRNYPYDHLNKNNQ